MKSKHFLFICISLSLLASCYHGNPVTKLPNLNKVKYRTLFIGLDGVDYTLMNELASEGYFKEFKKPVPMVSTFPSATTIGFTGIFQPLGVGQVQGYESRFYSYKDNKIVGGTPLDVYKYPIAYKDYFDYFRHTMQSKSVMYSFPSMASKQDLVSTRHTVFNINKHVVMTYLGGTDGSAHLLGRNRTKHTLKFMSDFLDKLQVKYQQKKGEPLRIVLFSDHGFQYNKLKTVSNGEMKRKLFQKGYTVSTEIHSDNDIVFTRFGLISSGVGYTNLHGRDEKARTIATVKGVDLVFWHLDDKHKIYIRDSMGQEAYFEYKGKSQYRYVQVSGDPIGYQELLKSHHYRSGQWIADREWKEMSYDAAYPDVGYRLYESFFDLVQNSASIMFSTKPNYQFGSIMARIGTWTRLGQEGTHGGLFRQSSWAFVMTNMDANPNPPKHFRYDEMFSYYIPDVTNKIRKTSSKNKKSTPGSNGVVFSIPHSGHNHQALNQQLAGLEKMILE